MSDANDEKRERMLAYIRDVLIARSQMLRESFELNSFLYCQSPEGQSQLKQAVAVEAAADVFTHLVAEWQREHKRPEDNRPDWLRAIVNQGMATFIEGLK